MSARGRVKLVGTAQRVVRGGSLLGAVVVVRGGRAGAARSSRTSTRRSGSTWDPATAGAAEDDVPGLTVDGRRAAVLDAYDAAFGPFEPGEIEGAALERARALAARHRLR